jgi:hypothetical protein
MKNRQRLALAFASLALTATVSPPGFSLPTDPAQIADPAHPLTLHATVQQTGAAKKAMFSASGDKPASLTPAKSKFGPVKKVATSAASLLNFVFDVRGFDWSKEGANAILEEKLKPKGAAACEFLKHRAEDEQELSLVATTLQLASVEGKDDKKTKEAVDNIAKLIGIEEANKLHDKIQQAGIAAGAGGSDLSADDKASVDVSHKCDRLRIILEAASETDPVVAAMTKRLHKYNHRNKFLQVTAKVVYVTMGIASFAPTLAAPIAETTLLTFMTVTGGPEQDKLLKEVYLSKCLQSRANLITEKAHLAVDCYDMAVLTKNVNLLACSKDLIRQMTDEKTMAVFLGTAPAAAVASTTSPAMAAATTPAVATSASTTQPD